LGLTHLTSFFQFPFGKSHEVRKDDIKVISYNINLFHLYSWSKTGPTYKNVFEFIAKEKAKIVCLQEFYVENSKFTERQAKASLKMNSHISYVVKKPKSGYGLATYSSYPIVGSGEIKFDKTANACIYTNIKIGKDTIRVYNIHLQSLKLKGRNMNFLLDENYRKDSQKMNEIKEISFRYRDAIKKRAQQVELVTNHIQNSPYPVIVCGDFNDSPISHTYRQMKRNLKDAFVEAGTGVGHTYKGFFPSFRIDYILFNSNFSATSYYSPSISYSDHYPVVTTLRLNKE
jgi:endonuclease/exonuclease/phosphatase family metal-dependent hydrolase